MVELEKIGKAITYLRKRAGYTQKDLADRIGISDKAVSKWERGLGLPDVSYLSKLSILLDTDTDSLLNGDVINHQECWNGYLLFEESEIKPDTVIYDKPLSSYLLSYFLLVGIRKIIIQCSEEDQLLFHKEYGNGSKLGVEIVYLTPFEEVEFGPDCTNVMAVFGKSFIYGVYQTKFFQKAMSQTDKIVVLSLPKESDNGRLKFNEFKKITDDETAISTQYEYYRVPVAFMPVDKINAFLMKDLKLNECLYTEFLDRGFVEIPINNPDDVFDASQFVKTVQKYCEMHMYCIEEIAWRRGMITIDRLKELAQSKEETEYGKYLLKLCLRNELK